MHYPDHLLRLIEVFKKLPGIGAKSAERFAFELIDWPEEKLAEMSLVIGQTPDLLNHCETCGALIGTSSCELCDSTQRETHIMCIVGSSKDIFSIEETHQYKGLYHVLGALLSPLANRRPSPEAIEKLKARLDHIDEVIIALDSTLEGDATALFVKKELEPYAVTISRLALGLPMGSSLDYIDGGTLTRAFQGRHAY